MKVKKYFIKSARFIPQVLLLISVLTSNVFFPAIAIAQELPSVDNTPQEEVVDIPIDTSEDILDEGVSTSIFEEQGSNEANEPLFIFENGVYTVNTVVQGEEYVYPDNGDVRITFNEVSEDGNLVIKRVTLTDSDREDLNTTEKYAWDISSTMSNGSFKYDLTLPNTQGNDVEVKYTEDGSTYESVDDVSLQSDTVVLKGLDHFTTFVVASGVTDGTTCTVSTITGTCYETIQEAIDNADPSDEIYVDTTYDSTLETFPIHVNQEVKIYGAQADTDPRPTIGGRSGSETVIDGRGSQIMRIEANNVEINGFEFVNGSNYMVEQRDSHSNYLFNYNIVHDQNGDDAIKVRTCFNCEIKNNYIYDIAYPGDGIGVSGATDCVVENNQLEGQGSENAAIYVYGSTNTSIVGNIVNGTTDNDGIKLGAKNGSDALSNSGIIKDNIVSNTAQDGISVYSSDVLVENNEITNSSSVNGALYLAFGISNITITGNKIHDNNSANGVKIGSGVNVDTVTVNNNEIYNNTNYGIYNFDSDLLNAQSNWWGDPTGPNDTWSGDGSVPDTNPGTGNSVRGAVDYSNWITSMDNTPPSIPVLQSPIGGVYINDNTPLMQWEDSYDDSGIAGYYYRIYFNCSDLNDPSTCSSVYPNSTGQWRSISEYQAGVTPDNTYYWQVKAVDTVGNESDWSDLERFTIDTQKPIAPVIVYPNAEEYFNTTPILNDWTDVTDPSGIAYYRVEYVYDDHHSFPNMPYRTTTSSQRNHTPNINEQGGVTITVQAIDNAGNESAWSDPVHYTYDATEPTIPTNLTFKTTSGDILGCNVGTTDYTIIADWDESTDASPITYEYRSYNPTDGWIWNGGNIGDVTEREGSFTVGEGVYGFAVRAKDAADNYSDWTSTDLAGSCQITYDTTAPTVSDITITKDGNPVTYVKEGDTIKISATVIDTLVGIKAVTADYSYNDTYTNRPTPRHTTMHHTTGNTYETTFTIPSGWNEGNLYVTVAALDNLDNYDGYRSLAELLIIDNTNPESRFSFDLSGNSYNTTPITIMGSSNDKNNVDMVELYYTESGTSNWIKFATLTNDSHLLPFDWSTDFNPPYQGTFDIKAEATDIAGNQENSPIMTGITFDTTNPKISNPKVIVDYLSKYVNGYTGFLITAKPTDNLSGINTDSCMYTLDGSSWYAGYYMLGRCNFSVSSSQLFDNQNLSISVNVADNAGNTSTSAIVKRTVDKALPKSMTVIPKDYYGPNALPVIGGLAGDSVSGISDVRVTVQRNSDDQYMHSFLIWKWWDTNKDLLSTSGTNLWTFNTPILDKENGVMYTVTPYAWDHVHLTPGKGVSDSFIWDSQDPQDPTTIESSSHNPNQPSQNTQIVINFSGAHDYGLSGVKGYFYSFSNEPETPSISLSNWLPVGTNTVTSPVLPDGTWYFNIRTVDNVRNITSTAHSGAFIIDTTPPDPISDVVVYKGHNSDSENLLTCPTGYTNNTQIRIEWEPSTDPDLDYYWFGTQFNDHHRKVSASTTHYDANMTPGHNPYYYTVIAVDKAGNESLITTGSTSCDVILDQDDPTKPELEGFLNPDLACGSYTNVANRTVTVDWSDSTDSTTEIKGYQYQISYPTTSGGRAVWTTYFNGPTSQYRGTLNEGTHYIRVRAEDMAGNWSPWSNEWTDPQNLTGDEMENTCSITYDSIAPVVGITNPLNAETVSGVVDIRGWVTDANLSHYNIAIYPDGVDVHDFSLRIEQNTEYTSEFTEKSLFTWDTTNNNFPDGIYQIRLAARDLAGNRELDGDSEEVIQVTVDNTAPVTTLEDISYTYTNQPIFIEGTSEDALSGVDSVDLLYKLSTETTWTPLDTIDNPNDDSPFSWNYTWTPPTEGTYDIKAEAIDTVGNQENSPEIYAITYDVTPPTITLMDILTGLLSITAEDLLSGTNTIEIKINNGQWMTYTSNMNLLTLVNNEPGTYTIHVKVTDKAGNIKEGSTIFVVEEPEEGTVAGATTQNVYAALPLGTGQGEEIVETQTTEEEVLGEETKTCENPVLVKGYIYYDRNKDEVFDSKEKGLADVNFSIYYTNEEIDKKVVDLKTDENGYWETNICAGDYYIVVNQEDLPKNLETPEVISLQIADTQIDTVEFNISATDMRSFWQRYWYLVVIGSALLLTIIYLMLSRQKKEQQIQ